MKLILIIFCFINVSFSQAPSDDSKTIYQYKKYEKFDLGSLEVDGELLAPGDVSVRERERLKVQMDLFNRKRMDDFKKDDAQSLK
jgi:hypothetical protein